MPTIVFIEHDGQQHRVDAPSGTSLMQIAQDNLIPGIPADCGGYCSCATCHAYIDKPWFDQIPPPNADELAMLSGAVGAQENSRLTCQLKMTDALDGIVIRIPESQI